MKNPHLEVVGPVTRRHKPCSSSPTPAKSNSMDITAELRRIGQMFKQMVPLELRTLESWVHLPDLLLEEGKKFIVGQVSDVVKVVQKVVGTVFPNDVHARQRHFVSTELQSCLIRLKQQFESSLKKGTLAAS